MGVRRNSNALLQDLSETLQIIGTNDFGKLVDDAKITKKGGADMNITVFAPTNAAIKTAEAKVSHSIRMRSESPSALTLTLLIENFRFREFYHGSYLARNFLSSSISS